MGNHPFFILNSDMRIFFLLILLVSTSVCILSSCSSTSKETKVNKKTEDTSYVFDKIPPENSFKIENQTPVNKSTYVVQIGAFSTFDAAGKFGVIVFSQGWLPFVSIPGAGFLYLVVNIQRGSKHGFAPQQCKERVFMDNEKHGHSPEHVDVDFPIVARPGFQIRPFDPEPFGRFCAEIDHLLIPIGKTPINQRSEPQKTEPQNCKSSK